MLVDREAAAAGEADAEHVEQPAAHARAAHFPGFAEARQREDAAGPRFHAFEGLGAGLNAHEVGRRELVGGAVRVDGAHLVQAVGRAERQRLDQHGVHDAEDGGVRADAEGEGEDGDRGEPRGAPQGAHGVRRVLPQFADELDSRHSSSSPLVDRHALGPRPLVIAEARARQLTRA